MNKMSKMQLKLKQTVKIAKTCGDCHRLENVTHS